MSPTSGVAAVVRDTRTATELRSLDEMLRDSMQLSGAARRAFPVRKWPGVRTLRSSGSDVRAVRGREFKQASIGASNVLISLYVRRTLPMERLR